MLVTELKPEIYVFIKCCELSGLCLHNNLFVADNFKEIIHRCLNTFSMN